ncbi:Maf family protein [Castellaniella sp. GW247-6E4]|uniref:Maf family protein n=1 Tax=Castellaniella sp. GW247-6E4 TaxID=3140380 RepID=UPI003316309C
MTSPPLYLASASPRRREILDQLGIPHQVLHVPAPEGEDEPQWPGEAAADYVRRTAREKAERAVRWLADPDRPEGLPSPGEALILAADTTVILDGEVLGKPRDLADAASMLARLSGRPHHVHTAVALAAHGRILESLSVSEVQFTRLSPHDIQAYCATGEPLGKAGAYGIQGRAGRFVQHLSGSYTGVMGLPAYEIAELLKQARDNP